VRLAQTGRDRAQRRNRQQFERILPGNIRAAVVTSASRLHVADPRRVETRAASTTCTASKAVSTSTTSPPN